MEKTSDEKGYSEIRGEKVCGLMEHNRDSQWGGSYCICRLRPTHEGPHVCICGSIWEGEGTGRRW